MTLTFHKFPVIVSTAVLCLCFSCKGELQKPIDSRVLAVSPLSDTISSEESLLEFSISTNITPQVSIDASWLSVQSLSQTELVVKASANPAGSSRLANIKVADSDDRYFYKGVTLVQNGSKIVKTVLNIVDKNATERTKALYANLWLIADKGFMFGHHDDLMYGRYWYGNEGGSDTKDVCGSYPAVYSLDFAQIADNRREASVTENAVRRKLILQAYSRGEVILACMHINNPKTLGDSWDKTSCVGEILTEGSGVNVRYKAWMDALADFANNLKDDGGELIPVIFRPYHEMTQSWSWWGTSACSRQEYVKLWQWTVSYLKETKGVHNFIYATSPQMDADYKDSVRSRLLTGWPGDAYVDFLGMDCYQGLNASAFASNIKAIRSLSLEKNKPCGVTETGVEGFRTKDFWSKYIFEPATKGGLSCIVMWRNKYVSSESDNHFFSVYRGHPSEDDFRTFYSHSETIFSGDLPQMYVMPENIEVI